MKRIKEKEWWVILFILGVIVLNYPFIVIFNKTIFVFGYPLFFLYIYVGWAISILMIFIFTQFGGGDRR